MKIHATYTIECDYEYDDKELIQEYDNEEEMINSVKQFIQEDFSRVECRADNVLPSNYQANLKIYRSI